MKYVYPAIFYRAIEGGYCIDFPDVSGASSRHEATRKPLRRSGPMFARQKSASRPTLSSL